MKANEYSASKKAAIVAEAGKEGVQRTCLHDEVLGGTSGGLHTRKNSVHTRGFPHHCLLVQHLI